MKAVPKYDENWTGDIVHNGVVEFQILDTALLQAVGKCRRICDADTIFYHLPFGMHDIGYYAHPNTEWLMENFLAHLRRGHEFVIAHANVNLRTFEAHNGLKLLEKCRDFIYLENSIASPNEDDMSIDKAWEIAEAAGVHTVCDLTHLLATDYLYGIGQTVPSGCRYFHFAACLDHDGVRDKARTHGRAHRSYSAVVEDMHYLEAHGAQLADALICTEVSESDYRNRPRMKQELEYVKQYIREVYS